MYVFNVIDILSESCRSSGLTWKHRVGFEDEESWRRTVINEINHLTGEETGSAEQVSIVIDTTVA